MSFSQELRTREARGALGISSIVSVVLTGDAPRELRAGDARADGVVVIVDAAVLDGSWVCHRAAQARAAEAPAVIQWHNLDGRRPPGARERGGHLIARSTSTRSISAARERLSAAPRTKIASMAGQF